MLPIDDNLRSQVTAAEAVAGLQAELCIRIRLTRLNPDQALNFIEETCRTANITGRACTYVNVIASLWNQTEGFMKGNNSLYPLEREALGDISGKTLLHLQCQFGMDTLSWARLGAKVTGVDYSDVAIELANSINKELKLPAKFICSNIYGDLNTICSII